MSTSVTRSGIDELRERIRRLESAAGRRRLVLPFGIQAIDRHLPGGGVALGALHEVAGGGNGRSMARPRRSLRRESLRARGEKSYGA
jgi:protein ImuA